MKIRVLVIDGSVVSRRFLAKAMENTRDLEAVGFSANGALGLKKITQLQPDVVVLDVFDPERGDFETLRALRASFPQLPIIMFSETTVQGAEITLEALSLGANDYAEKPKSQDEVAEEQLRSSLFPKIRALAVQTACFTIDIPTPPPAAPPRPAGPAELLLIGASTGGPEALAELLPQLPASLPVPVVVVQHMPPSFTKSLALRLDAKCELEVTEANDGERLEPGRVLIAPGDHHLELRRGRNDRYTVRLSDGPPENSCRPAVDVMFRSAAYAARGRVLAVVLTGMGKDGLLGAQRIHQAGGTIFAQDKDSSVVWGMPGYISKAKIAKEVLPLDRLSRAILKELRAPARDSAEPPKARLTQW